MADVGARQDFRYRSLGCPHHADGSWGAVYKIWVGQDIVALVRQLADANAQIAQLEAQLKQTPPPAPPDPKATEAVAALIELAKALKLVEEAA